MKEREWVKSCLICESEAKKKKKKNRVAIELSNSLESKFRDGWKENEGKRIKRSVPSFTHKISKLKATHNHIYEPFHNCSNIFRNACACASVRRGKRMFQWPNYILYVHCFGFYFLSRSVLFFLLKCIQPHFIPISFTPLSTNLKSSPFSTFGKQTNDTPVRDQTRKNKA